MTTTTTTLTDFPLVQRRSCAALAGWLANNSLSFVRDESGPERTGRRLCDSFPRVSSIACYISLLVEAVAVDDAESIRTKGQ